MQTQLLPATAVTSVTLQPSLNIKKHCQQSQYKEITKSQKTQQLSLQSQLPNVPWLEHSNRFIFGVLIIFEKKKKQRNIKK